MKGKSDPRRAEIFALRMPNRGSDAFGGRKADSLGTVSRTGEEARAEATRRPFSAFHR